MPKSIFWYMDEHVPFAATQGLRQRGLDVTTVQELNLAGAEDDFHITFATSLERVIFTQDADFLRIAASGQPHSGIVYAHQRTPIGEIIRGRLLIAEVYTA